MTWAIGCAIGFFTIGVLLWRATVNAHRIQHPEDQLATIAPYDLERDPDHDPCPDWARHTLTDIRTLP